MAGLRELHAFHFGDAEIGDLRHAFIGNQNICGLYVAMYHAAAVGIIECLGHLLGDIECLRHRQRPAGGIGHHTFERAPLHELHHQIGLPPGVFGDVVNRHDAAVRHLSRGARFAVKALLVAFEVLGGKISGQNDLDGHRAVNLRINRLIDRTHSAAAQLLDNFVAADAIHGQAAYARLGEICTCTTEEPTRNCDSFCNSAPRTFSSSK